METGVFALTVEQWVGVGSALLAAASFLFNWAVVGRQSRMQFESLKAQMDADLLAWAGEAVGHLAQAAYVAKGRGAYLSEQELRTVSAQTARDLSACADKGRLFFPNLAARAHGADKEGAFQGFRPPVLDALIFALYRLEKMDIRNTGPDVEAAAYFVKCRRVLISEVQRAVDPRRRGQMLAKLAKIAPDGAGFAEVAGLAEALEAAYPGTMSVKRDAAWVEEMAKRRRRS
jgi:hypothetical protein